MKSNAWLRGVVFGAAMSLAGLASSVAYAADALEVATVGNANPVAWLQLIAARKGMFTAEGLKVDIIYVPSSAQLTQQVAAGSVNLGFAVGLVDPIRAVGKGAPIALVRLEGQAAPFALVGKPSIKRIADLKGKTIIIGGEKDITHFYLDRMLVPNGLKQGDYDLIFSGSTPARYAALKSGAVDAAMLFPPFNLFALDDGFSNLGLVVDYAPNLPFSGTVANRTWANSHQALVKRYLSVITKAVAWFNTDANRNEAVAILVDAMHGKPENLAKTYDFFRKIGFFEPTGKLSRTKIEEIADMLKSTGDIPKDFDLNSLAISSLVPISN